MAVLVSIILSPLAVGASSPPSLYLLAVSENDEGVAIPVTLVYGEGSGVNVVPSTVGVDTVLSARLAWVYASILDGRGVPITLVFPEPDVKGASAGAVLAVAFMASFRGMVLGSSFSGTGMLSPLGLILPVKGVEAKVEAAAEKGIGVIVVPLGFSVVGKGVRVVDVCTVPEALAVLAGGEPVSPTVSFDKLSESVSGLFEEDAERLIALARRLGINVSDAERLAAEGRLYSAASRAFAELVKAGNPIIINEVLKLVEGVSLQEALDRTVKRLDEARSIILSRDTVPLNKLLALVEADYRMFIAERMAANESTRPYAALRLLTVYSWLRVAERLGGVSVPVEAVKTAARILVDYASTSYDYLRAVSESEQEVIMEDGRPVSSWVSDARMYLVTGNYVRAIALALRVLEEVDAVLSLATLGPGNATLCYKRLAAWYTVWLEEHGLPVQLPSLFVSYALASSSIGPLIHAAALALLELSLAHQLTARVTPSYVPQSYTVLLTAIASSASAALAALIPLALRSRLKEV